MADVRHRRHAALRRTGVAANSSAVAQGLADRASAGVVSLAIACTALSGVMPELVAFYLLFPLAAFTVPWALSAERRAHLHLSGWEIRSIARARLYLNIP